jgi:hypothetical protein
MGTEQSETPVDRLIDFEQAVVVTPMIYPPRPRLVVSGVTNLPMDVSLAPLVYISQPPYWGIQVVGSVGGGDDKPHVSQPIAGIPYSVELDLAGVTGTAGVEVIGATVTERLDVPTDVEGS